MRFVHTHADRTERAYAPSFFESGYLNATHSGLVETLEPVKGKLEPADVLKLYEAAYFADGPILEVGRLRGKSTVALALGARDGGHGHPIYSIERVIKYLPPAEDNLRTHEVYDLTTLIQGDSATQIPRVPGPLAVAFIDGDHSYDGVLRDIEALRGRVAPNGVVMFHDYWHPANETGEYGVRRAVDEADLGLEFRGRFGGIAMFEH